MIAAGPGNAALDIAREGRDRMIGQYPDRNPVPSQASRDGGTDMCAADNQRAGARLRRRHKCSLLAANVTGVWLESTPSPLRAITCTAARVTRRAAKPEPAIKRSSGPKLPTAAAPM